MTQRYPKGVPTYLSLENGYDTMETKEAIEEISPAKDHVNPRRISELPSASSGFKQNRIPPPMNYENSIKHHRSSFLPPQPIKRPVSLPYRSHSPINARKPQSRRQFDDPIINKCSSPSSSESESEDENRSNRYNEYGNNFSTVILDLKKKFVTSYEAQPPTMKKNCSTDETGYDDFQKGSDYIEDARRPSLDRRFSFDDSQGQEAMKHDLEEVWPFYLIFCVFSTQYFINKTNICISRTSMRGSRGGVRNTPTHPAKFKFH